MDNKQNIKQVIAVRKDLKMHKGKIAGQVAHAAMAFITRKMIETAKAIEDDMSDSGDYIYLMELMLNQNEYNWIKGIFTKAVVGVDSEQELLDLVAKAKDKGIIVHEITDAGLTVFHGIPTLTCAAFGPDKAEVLDEITGHLPLL